LIRFYKTPWLLKRLFPEYEWHKQAAGKKIYLTFDDGPIPEITPWVLEQLKLYNAKGTFFCVGENVVKHPEVAEQIMAEGHKLANHTFNHLKGWQESTDHYVANTEQCHRELESYLPDSDQNLLFRPPYGRISLAQASILKDKYRIVMWDVLTNDYDQSLSPEKCLQKSIKHTQSGSIVVFHDSVKAKRNLMYVLPLYLEHFTSLGYTFKAL
jgi:peptidoglycan-N-acetylglucosamine deacetylase